jgi:hypothetical protein
MNTNNANEGHAETSAEAEHENKEEQPKPRGTMDVLIYICGALVIISGAVLSFLGISGGLKDHRSLGLWVLFLTILFALTGAFLYFQKRLGEGQAVSSPASMEPPEVFFKGADIRGGDIAPKQPIIVDFILNNAGGTAYRLNGEFFTAFEETNTKKPLDYSMPFTGSIAEARIVKGEDVRGMMKSGLNPQMIDDFNVSRLKAGTSRFVIWGRLRYEDGMSPAKKYVLPFCFIYDTDSPTKLKLCPKDIAPRPEE